MTELERIQQDFLRGQELMLRAFNDLLRYQTPLTTGLYPSFGAVESKPVGVGHVSAHPR